MSETADDEEFELEDDPHAIWVIGWIALFFTGVIGYAVYVSHSLIIGLVKAAIVHPIYAVLESPILLVVGILALAAIVVVPYVAGQLIVEVWEVFSDE